MVSPRSLEAFHADCGPRIRGWLASGDEQAKGADIFAGAVLLAGIAVLAPALYFLWKAAEDLETVGIVGLIAGLLVFYLSRFKHWTLDARVKNHLMDQVCRYLGYEHMADDQAFPKELLKVVGLSNGSVGDYIRGTYRGVRFDLGDVSWSGKNQPVRHAMVFVFQGLQSIPGQTALRRIGTGQDRIEEAVDRASLWIESVGGRLKRVDLGDGAVEAQFQLYSDQPSAARVLLTPEWRRAVLALQSSTNVPVEFGWAGQRVIVSLKVGTWDPYEVGEGASRTDPARVDAMFREVSMVHTIVDQLAGVFGAR